MVDKLMLESYWRKYIDIMIAETYYTLYAQNTNRWIFAINAFCLVCAISGVSAFLTEALSPFWASTIVLASQVVGSIQVLLPFSERLYAARLINSELKELSLHAQITVDRYLFERISDDDLFIDMEWLATEFESTKNKFAPADLFPRKMGLHKKAEKDVLQHINIHYITEVSENANENKDNA